jgi:heme-degrading monooxygenase HmoA
MDLQPLDIKIPIFRQLDSTFSGPVVLLNIFKVEESDVSQLLSAWQEDASWMKKQLGFISTQLHQGIAGSTVFMNYAVWESVEHFRAAFRHPEFKNSLEKYPSSTIAMPHLFQRLSISNLCVGP